MGQAKQVEQPKSKGRVCAKDGCDTIINSYNDKPYCYQHYKPEHYSTAPCKDKDKKEQSAKH